MTPAPAPLPGLPEWATDADLGDDEDLVRAYGLWAEQIVRVYRLVKTRRSAQIRDEAMYATDERGLDPVSYEFGRAEQIWGDRVLSAYRGGFARAWVGNKPPASGFALGEQAFAADFYMPFSIGPLRRAAKRSAEEEFARSIRSAADNPEEEVDPWQ